MNEFNQMYNFVESKYDWYKRAREHVAHEKERHYHRCERKRFNGVTFRHKTPLFKKRSDIDVHR